MNSPVLTRREAFHHTGLGLASLALFDSPAPMQAAAPVPAAPGLTPFQRFPRMMQEHFVRKLRLHDELHRTRILAIRTKGEAEAYVRDVRRRIQASFGPWPEKTDLKPRVTGALDYPEYRMEKVIFESRPGFLVTANLYLSKGAKGRVPGVVGSCGHSSNGKAAEAYQSFAQGLARLGYACLIFDPIGQGERLQYVDARLKPTVGIGVREHLHGGNQQHLVGESFASWRAWDGIRALDYLLSRPEVDPAHVGITGNSGGGTMTTWLTGVEPRWTMSAPSCFVTTFRHNLENELPADTEQCPPRALALGLDHCDFLAALAPKPVIILAKEQDYFDARGAEEAHARLRHLYRALGAEENAGLFIGPTTHGYTQENREAMYQWFNRATKVSEATKEPPIRIEKDEALWCTPQGQVAAEKSRTVFHFTREASERLKGMRQFRSEDLGTRIRRVLNLPNVSGVPGYRIIRDVGSRKYPLPYYINYAVETEPGIQAVVTRLGRERMYSRPPKSAGRVTLYVSHHSADAELRGEPLVARLLKDEPETPFYAMDPRGIGDSMPGTAGMNSFLTPYGSDYFYAAYGLMLDQPIAGQRTFDVLRVVEWLKSLGFTAVHLVGRGWGSVPATFAAALSDAVRQVTLQHALRSFSEVAETEHYHWPLALMPHGVLAHLDLPDVYAALQAKGLKQIEPWNAKSEVAA